MASGGLAQMGSAQPAAELHSHLDAEARRLLELAATQRMNTDTRCAIFVAVMGAADVVHAHERVLRLPLKVGAGVRACAAQPS